MNPKQFVMDVLSGLPDECSLQEVRDESELALALYDSIEMADRGEVIPHEEVMRHMRELIASKQPALRDSSDE